jgi:hypothetical protein
VSDGGSASQDYTFAAATKTGRLAVDCIKAAWLGNAAAYYSFDGGSNFTNFGYFPFTRGTVYSPSWKSVDMSNLQIRVGTSSNPARGGSCNATVYEINFLEDSATPPYAQMTGNILKLAGDNSSYGEAYRPFPGRDPQQDGVIMLTGEPHVVMLQARGTSTNTTYDIEVLLRNASTNDTHLILTVPNDEIAVADWQIWADRYTPTEDIVGDDWEIVVRTLNLASVDVDKLGVFRGESIREWMPSAEELVTRPGDRGTGRATNWTRGSWGRLGRRRSWLTGDSK